MSLSIRGTVQAAIIRALGSHQALAEHVLRKDQQALVPLTVLIYELLKSGQNIDLRG